MLTVFIILQLEFAVHYIYQFLRFIGYKLGGQVVIIKLVQLLMLHCCRQLHTCSLPEWYFESLQICDRNTCTWMGKSVILEQSLCIQPNTVLQQHTKCWNCFSRSTNVFPLDAVIFTPGCHGVMLEDVWLLILLLMSGFIDSVYAVAFYNKFSFKCTVNLQS